MAHHQFTSESGDPHRRPHSSGDDTTRLQEREGGGRGEGAPAAAAATATALPEEGSAMTRIVMQQPRHGSSYPQASGSGELEQSPSRRRFPAVSRSIPIAIRGRGGRNSAAGAATDPDTTTSDEDDYDDHGDPLSTKDGRLLRAPYLGSLPSNLNAEELMMNHHNSILLPASAAAAELETNPRAAAGTTVAASYTGGGRSGRTGYGSLRESNMMGRFLDGPASYRERGTGGIVQLSSRNRGVRFDASSSSSATASTATASGSKPPIISIGDQLMMHAQRRKASGTTDASQSESQPPPPPSSSLSAMLESSSLENNAPSTLASRSQANLAPIPSAYDASAASSRLDDFDSADPSLLSMSLTGLEVLHSLRHLRGSAARSGFTGGRASGDGGTSALLPGLETLPRDANGQNALLSRSFSDPTPHLRRLDLRQPPTHTPTDSASGHGPTSVPTNSATTFDFHDASLPPTSFVASPVSDPTETYNYPTTRHSTDDVMASDDAVRAASPLWEDGTAPPASHDNPDTEGAFEMDLE